MFLVQISHVGVCEVETNIGPEKKDIFIYKISLTTPSSVRDIIIMRDMIIILTPREKIQVSMIVVVEILAVITVTLALLLMRRAKLNWRAPHNFIIINIIISEAMSPAVHFWANIHHLIVGETTIYHTEIARDIFGYVHMLAFTSSLLLISALAYERYLTVVWLKDITLKHALALCATCWINSFATASLPFWTTPSGIVVAASRAYCIPPFYVHGTEFLAYMYTSGILFAFAVMVISYWRIVSAIKQSHTQLSVNGVIQDEIGNQLPGKKEKQLEELVTRKSIAVIASFFIHTAPVAVDLLFQGSEHRTSAVLSTLANFFTKLHGIVNPIIIVLFDPQLRQTLQPMMFRDTRKDAEIHDQAKL